VEVLLTDKGYSVIKKLIGTLIKVKARRKISRLLRKVGGASWYGIHS